MEKEGNKSLPIFFRYRIVWHIIFWIAVYLAYTVSFGGYGGGKYYYEAIINLILMPVRIIFTYLLIYFLIPQFLLKNRYNIFITGTLSHAFLYGFAIWMHFYFFVNFPEYWCCSRNHPVLYIPKILVSIIQNYGIPLFAVIIKLFKWWYLDQLYKSKLEKEKLSSELKYLKSQIHPHFLFNTLNNLYALTLKKSEKASDVVIKLSNLLDYMLYHSGEERIDLEKEIEIIKSYIELEKIRYDNRLNFEFDVEGETSSIKIAPLILFTFIENAFKHGASNDSRHPYIKVKLVLTTDSIELRVKNSIPVNVKSNSRNNEGIGLKNVCRRLELIYPGHYSLDLKKEEDNFQIDLNIMLNK